MAWFDDLNLPGAEVEGYFGFVSNDGPDENENPDVMLASGSVTFTPTAEAARVGDVWLGIQPVTAQIFEGRIMVSEANPSPVRILSTDAETAVLDWAWKATFNVNGFKLNPVTFKAPAGETVNLTAGLIPVTSAPYQIVQGEAGESAYEVAVANGFVGTETEWLASLQGESGASTWDGITGKPTAYPPSTHTHDDRYYTEAEVDAKIVAAASAPGTMGNPIDIGLAHLDTITTPNHYTQRFTSRATKANGYPYESKAGVLEVLAWIPGSGIIQRWTSQAGGVATRYMLSGTWQAWQNAMAQTIT